LGVKVYLLVFKGASPQRFHIDDLRVSLIKNVLPFG
jgi:hypothetical protein